MTQPTADMSKDATDEAEKEGEVIGGQQVVQAHVHQPQATQEPDDTQQPEDYLFGEDEKTVA